ncbi:4'-phosphopantetheinyl transferase superfamily protein [Streptomyces racemochromogenes]|uniref:4'-phosphopantetheinyl transferase superfamily protein n=1 Tax=Streptomyces racemochromogenes TaxID=67353 RepID=A0ABW7PQQ3_9ACTN
MMPMTVHGTPLQPSSARTVTCHVWVSRRLPRPERHLGLLDEAERARCSGFVHERDLSLFVTGRVLARSALGSLTGLAPDAVRLRTRCAGCGGAHGKPQVIGEAAGWELSISHSGDLVAVAMADGHPLGVDVEQFLTPEEPGIPVEYALVLTPEEQAAVESLPVEERAGACLTLWTRKEAVLKATGEGLNTPMDSFTVSAADQPPAVLAWHGAETSDRPFPAMVDLPRIDGCFGALAVLGADSITPYVRPGAEIVAERLR